MEGMHILHNLFTAKGEEYVTNKYFMNLPAGKYQAYPEGQKDNTHFQPEGAREVARLVFEGLQELKTLQSLKEKKRKQ